METVIPGSDITNQTGQIVAESACWLNHFSIPVLLMGALLTLIGIGVGIGIGIALLIKKSKS